MTRARSPMSSPKSTPPGAKAVLDAHEAEEVREYAEREVNQLLNQWHSYQDPATLRRALYDAQLLDRTLDGARYWRAPLEDG